MLYICIAILVSLLFANLIAIVRERNQLLRIKEKSHKINSQCLLSKSKSKTPVTILTGFLGSGKTTLINHILRDSKTPYKILIIENEVGAINIDDALLNKKNETQIASGIYVMANGCICCRANSSGNELERILDHLINLPSSTAFDYLIIELSGLADPAPVVRTFMELRPSHFYIDSVIAMVCAKSIYHYIKGRFAKNLPLEIRRQLIYADVILLNKIDLIDNIQLEDIKNNLISWNPNSLILSCTNAIVDINNILFIQAFDLNNFKVSDCSSSHTLGVETVSCSHQGNVNLEKLHKWLAEVVDSHRTDNIFRIKGIVSVLGEKRQCVVQCVLDTFTTVFTEEWKDDNRESKIVFIGFRLNGTSLQECFKECFFEECFDLLDSSATSGLADEQKKLK